MPDSGRRLISGPPLPPGPAAKILLQSPWAASWKSCQESGLSDRNRSTRSACPLCNLHSGSIASPANTFFPSCATARSARAGQRCERYRGYHSDTEPSTPNEGVDERGRKTRCAPRL